MIFACLGLYKAENRVAYADNQIDDTEHSSIETRDLIEKSGHQYMRVYKEFGDVETFETSIQSEYVDYFSSEVFWNDTSKVRATSQDVNQAFAENEDLK